MLTIEKKAQRIKKYERWIAKRSERKSEVERDSSMIIFYQNKIAKLQEQIMAESVK